jgi:hypothetical protein
MENKPIKQFLQKINVFSKLKAFISKKIEIRKFKKAKLKQYKAELDAQLKIEAEKELMKSNFKKLFKADADRVITTMSKSNLIDSEEKDIKNRQDLVASAKLYNEHRNVGPKFVDFNSIEEHNNTLNPQNPTIHEIKIKDNEEVKHTLKKQARKVNQKYFEGESLGEKVKRLNKD